MEPLRQRFTSELDAAGVPGCSIAMVDHAGATSELHIGTADLATADPVGPATRFHLFSGTKLYTAAAVMRLVEDGALTLDADVRTWMPALPLRHPVTVRQLLSHTSGLPDTLRAFLAVHLAGDRVPSALDALDAYRLHRGRSPGRVAYRNSNYAILGALIEVVAGASYTRFVQSQILGPLGAGATFRAEGPTMATGYLPRWTPMRLVLRLLLPDVAPRLYRPPIGGLAAMEDYDLDTAAIGGLVGCARDFLPMLSEMLAPGDGVLRATSKHAMLSRQASGKAGIASDVGVGLGWKEGPGFWNHEGGGAGFCTETRLYPRDGLGLVILMNRSHTPALSRLAHAMCEQIRGARRGPTASARSRR